MYIILAVCILAFVCVRWYAPLMNDREALENIAKCDELLNDLNQAMLKIGDEHGQISIQDRVADMREI